MKKNLILLLSILAFVVAFQTIGQVVASQHTIAKVSFPADGRTVMASVMDDATISYQPFMTRTLISKEGGELQVVETTAASRGLLVKRREPSMAEARLWHRYFGS